MTVLFTKAEPATDHYFEVTNINQDGNNGNPVTGSDPLQALANLAVLRRITE